MALPPKKRQKLWIWKARDHDTGQFQDWEWGRHDAATLKKLIERLVPWGVAFYCTDRWKTYASVIPAEKLVKSKAKTDGIERNYCRSDTGLAGSNGNLSLSPSLRRRLISPWHLTGCKF